MDIIIRTRGGRQFLLIRTDHSPPYTSHFTRAQLRSLLHDAEPICPGTWAEIWQKIRPLSSTSPTCPQSAVAALQDLAARNLLLLIPYGSPRPARGAGGGKSANANINDELPPVPSAANVPPCAPPKSFADDTATSSDAPATGGDVPVAACKTEGEPISMISGEELLQLQDGVLPGPLPFAWIRTYRSSHRRDGGLGCGWTHSASEGLEIRAQQVFYRDADGREIPFQLPRAQQRSRYIPEGLLLDRVADETFILRQEGQPHRLFSRCGDHSNFFRLVQLRHPSYTPASNILAVNQAASGFAIDLHYNERNQLTQLRGTWGKSLVLGRNCDGRVARVELQDTASGARKILAEYDYDSQGDLVAQRNANGVGERYAYRNHLIQKRTLATGFNFYFAWDGDDQQARCVHQWGDRGIYDYRFEWHPEELRSKAIDSRGKTRAYQYNQYGEIVTELDGEGGLHQYTYERGRKRRYTDPEGNTTEYFFDRHNNPAGYRDALGNRVALSWFNGRITGVTDKDKSHWRREYDSKGQLVAVVDPFLQTTRYTYDTNGMLASVIDPMRRRTRYQWSARGELLVIADPEGHERHLAYDQWGQVSSAELILADGQNTGKIQFFRTPTGLVEKVVAPGGATTHYTYNQNDQLIRHSDPQGRTTTYQYDGLSQVIERVDPEGHRLRYEYDSERNLTALVNEKGEKHQFFYDGNERLVREIGFDGRVQHYQYDRAGRLIQHLDAGEVMTEFERDALGQLLTRTSRAIKQPSIEPEIARFRYDAKGRLLETYNAQQFVSFTYNAFGNLTKENHCDLNAQRQCISASMVDIGFSNVWPGRRSGIQLPDGGRIDYTFDRHHRLQEIIFNGAAVARIERDSLGREVRRFQGDLITFCEFDPAGRLQQQFSYHRRQKQTGPILRHYGYDAFGNLDRLSDGPEETRYVYDLLSRLKKAEGTIPEIFSFDPAGNLLRADDLQSTGGPRSACGQKNAPPDSVTGNRLHIQGDRQFTYDARGNLVRENRGRDGRLVTTFEYNLGNQLVKTTRGGQTTIYTYDPLGRRISKTDAFGITRYCWAGEQMVQEQRNNLKKTYIYEPESFRPVAQVADGEIYHYHLDHLGTPRELTDDRGKVVWKARYRAYGNVAVQEVEAIENNLRFQGQYFDGETGLHYNRFRYYNPESGQFITQDPLGLLGGVNNYQYAPNPLGWVDPLGLSCKEIPKNYDPLNDLYRPSLNAEQALHNKERTGRDIVFAGHGSLNPYRMMEIPAGTTLTVYSYPGAAISDALGVLIEKGQIPDSIYRKTFSAGDKTPELLLHPNCGDLILKDTSCQTKKTVSIVNLLRPNMGDCHWAACTYVNPSHKNVKILHHTDGIHYRDSISGVHKKYVDGKWVDVDDR